MGEVGTGCAIAVPIAGVRRELAVASPLLGGSGKTGTEPMGG